mgnify:CR=1 FL=1
MKIFDFNKIKYIILMLIVLLIGLIIYFIKMNDKQAYEDTLTFNETTNKTTSEVFEKNYIDIKGSVKNPGVYEFKKNDRVIDAINMAGGLLKNANTSNINLSQKLVSEMVIYVMNNSEIKNGSKVISCDTKCKTEVIEVNNCVEEKKLETSKNKININTATVEDFTSLSGIGKAKAKSIVEYRNSNGNFKSIEDIKNISGIGEALFNKIKDNIEV